MIANMKLDEEREVEVAKLKFYRKALGDQHVLAAALEALAENWADFELVATTKLIPLSCIEE